MHAIATLVEILCCNFKAIFASVLKQNYYFKKPAVATVLTVAAAEA